MTIAKKIAEKGTVRKLDAAKAGANAEISELKENLEEMVQIIALICASSEIQGGDYDPKQLPRHPLPNRRLRNLELEASRC